MRFEWDENKNLENIEKHKISFEIAQEAFFDKKRIIIKKWKYPNYWSRILERREK